MKKLLASLLLVGIFSCSSKVEPVPATIIPPEKMELVFWDYLRADTYGGLIQFDSTKNDTLINLQLQDAVFRKHKVSKELFYRSYQYYVARPEMMETIIDSMLASQNRKSKLPKKDNFKITE